MLQYIVTDCDILHVIFYFLDSSIKYILNATLRTIIACQMCVLEILERGEGGGGTLYNIFYCFLFIG